MKRDNIDKLFEDLQTNFDLEMPEPNHELRFLEKLTSKKNVIENRPKRSFHKPFLALAASIVLCFGLFILLQNKPELNGLAGVSPELSQTQDFFTAAIRSELNKINAQRSPENETVVSDALKQMALLEKNYSRLKIDLRDSGNDKRVIYAMISNFQSRIDLLEHVLKSIAELKQFNPSTQNQLTL